MLDYMENVTVSMQRNGIPLFQFAMESSITHEFVDGGRLIRGLLFDFLKRIYKKGVFNNTLFFLVSDHGNRIEEIRTRSQGFLEDRLPFSYIVVPPWFKSKYSTEYKNLLKNSKRLVAPYDIHKTLQDILKLQNPQEIAANNDDSNGSWASPGISLFQTIPLHRSCEDAGISEKFCACNMKLVPLHENAPIVTKGVNYAVDKINSIIESRLNAPCARVSLNRVISAEQVTVAHFRSQQQSSTIGKKYRLTFETNPGEAQFEAVLKITQEDSAQPKFDLDATIDRINVYKYQGWCVTNDRELMHYCYCNTQLNSNFI